MILTACWEEHLPLLLCVSSEVALRWWLVWLTQFCKELLVQFKLFVLSLFFFNLALCVSYTHFLCTCSVASSELDTCLLGKLSPLQNDQALLLPLIAGYGILVSTPAYFLYASVSIFSPITWLAADVGCSCFTEPTFSIPLYFFGLRFLTTTNWHLRAQVACRLHASKPSDWLGNGNEVILAVFVSHWTDNAVRLSYVWVDFLWFFNHFSWKQLILLRCPWLY